MKLEKIRLGLTYDDLLLIPQESNVLPKETKIDTYLTKRIHLNIPILSAAMDTVSEHEMGIALARLGGLAIIHKNLSIEDQTKEVSLVKEADAKGYPNAVLDKNGRLLSGAAISVSENMLERVSALLKAGVDVLVLDSAHGHSKNIINAVKTIRKLYPEINLIAGNIVTKEAAAALIDAGVDAVKVGIGPGSICTTRVIAGVGCPQATAVDEVATYCKNKGIGVIADGGLKYSGDIVKALALGANAVMLGSMLAGCDETPGEIIESNGKKYKSYVGMGSLAAMSRGSADRYFQDKNTEQNKLVPEGIEGITSYKGKVSDVIYQLLGGLHSGLGYCGAHNLNELKEKAVFIQVTNNGLIEGHPHDINIVKDAPNYQKR